jgi:hypothetical protein
VTASPRFLILTVVSRTTRNRVDVILAILLIVLPVNALLLLGVACALLARDLHVVRA